LRRAGQPIRGRSAYFPPSRYILLIHELQSAVPDTSCSCWSAPLRNTHRSNTDARCALTHTAVVALGGRHPNLPFLYSRPHHRWRFDLLACFGGHQSKRRGLYGECPERASPSPSAVVGTSPYNLLNGTAGKPPLWGSNRRASLSHIVITRGGHRCRVPIARKLSASTAPRRRQRRIGPRSRHEDRAVDEDSPRHDLAQPLAPVLRRGRAAHDESKMA
jgi:hypothetical protein